jgi:glycosyltransferase involved in cell wall biosynthesis
MVERLGLESNSVSFHPNGITMDGIHPVENLPAAPTLGYLARLSPLKGLDLLVDAFIQLKDEDKYEGLTLRIAGGMTDEDIPYVDEQRAKLTKAGLVDCVTIMPNISRKEKFEFLKNLSVFSVPARYPEAFGLYVIEALAAGIPVVLPNIGAFPEIVNATDGGRLYRSEDPNSLIESLDELLSQPAMSKSIGLKAHDFVIKEYANERLAKRLVENVLSPIMANQ